ncbi:hypothetical protein DFQ28_010787 [Apophysomyces sp. BC1034]|nr:hypothetical protein DFQ30_001203 [Apophysomyces sp. BC1015]KAG0181349.1 hypothetical protein DFQ29_008619 [Apophysomyces sp. BC1021]KAG0191848.1 hypothetical protein DFQ28_010787 [Apophysomyces sp. BC1034]
MEAQQQLQQEKQQDMYAFDKATNTKYLGKTTSGRAVYVGRTDKTWAVGEASSGGYVLSVMMDSMLQHYAERHQQHPIALNAFFLRKTSPGPVVIEIEDIKTSRKGYCLSRTMLKQPKDGQTVLRTLEEYDPAAYVENVYSVTTMGDMHSEKGATHLHKPWQPPREEDLEDFQYDFMGEHVIAKINTRNLPVPLVGDDQTPGRAEHDHIIEFRDGRPVDFKSIPYWSDMLISPPANLGTNVHGGRIWCATMQLEIQFKAIPSGNKVPSSFISSHLVNSRCDLDGALFDQDGKLLALTRHQVLALPWNRNTPAEKPGKSKL